MSGRERRPALEFVTVIVTISVSFTCGMVATYLGLLWTGGLA